MVRNNLGVAALSALSCEPYAHSKDLLLRPVAGPNVIRPISVMYRKGRSFSLASQALLDVILSGTTKAEPS